MKNPEELGRHIVCDERRPVKDFISALEYFLGLERSDLLKEYPALKDDELKEKGIVSLEFVEKVDLVVGDFLNGDFVNGYDKEGTLVLCFKIK